MADRSQRGDWTLECRAGLLALLLTGLAGCVIVPVAVKPEVSRSGDVRPPPAGGMTLSVVFSPDFSPLTSESLAREMVECVTRAILEAGSEVRLVPQDQFYRAVFPGLEPAEILMREDTIGALVRRPQIRQGIGRLGLTHVLLVGGSTTHDATSGGVTGGLGAAGAGWAWHRSSRLTASLFELKEGAEVVRVQATAQGHGAAGALLVPPVILGAGAATESSSCDALGVEVARAIRENAPRGTR